MNAVPSDQLPATRRADVRVPKAAELVAADIRRQIIGGDVAEDDPLPNEAELVTMYGVSRPTLREALRLLEAEGLIEVKRGVRGGPRVRVPDVAVTARHAALLLQMRGTTLQDLIDARLILEPAAVRRLAERSSPADVKALRAAHQAELDVGTDWEANAHQATLFHARLVELVGNQTLTLLNELLVGIQDIQNRTVVHRLEGRAASRVVADARHAHDEVIELIERGEAAQAEAAWTRHLKKTAALTRRMFGEARLVDIRTVG
jgi:GntR family transcriptional repressor for pyruvate dehydrogenase complex